MWGIFFALLAYRKVLTSKKNLPGCGEGLHLAVAAEKVAVQLGQEAEKLCSSQLLKMALLSGFVGALYMRNLSLR